MNRTVWAWGLAILGLLLLLAAPVGLAARPYILHIATVAFFYAILASSWSLLAGYAGQFSFAHMAFMAIGAYTAGLLGKFVRFTTAPTGTCSEIPVGKSWLVFLNISGDNCLDLARDRLTGAAIQTLPPLKLILLLLLLMLMVEINDGYC